MSEPAASLSRRDDLAPGQVLGYQPDRKRFEPSHCRDGQAICDGDGRPVDTYWWSGDGHVLTDEELASAEILYRLDDYREVASEHEWQKYAEADRKALRRQHGCYVTWLVRNGAEPDIETQIRNAYAKLRKAEEDLKAAGRDIEWAARDIAKLEAKRDG